MSSAEVAEKVVQNLMFFALQILGKAPKFVRGICKSPLCGGMACTRPPIRPPLYLLGGLPSWKIMRHAARPVRLFERDSHVEVVTLCCWYAIDNKFPRIDKKAEFRVLRDSLTSVSSKVNLTSALHPHHDITGKIASTFIVTEICDTFQHYSRPREGMIFLLILRVEAINCVLFACSDWHFDRWSASMAVILLTLR